MEKKELILTVVLGTLAVLLIISCLGIAIWFYTKDKRSKKRDSVVEDQTSESQPKDTKKRSFLNLKTPLISTKALVWVNSKNYLKNFLQWVNFWIKSHFFNVTFIPVNWFTWKKCTPNLLWNWFDKFWVTLEPEFILFHFLRQSTIM